ncbi:flavohemoglobin expression-modulating QEGLA motif protein [Tahibacter caeni]|uniref:flavohemoglobin expression-modulating QEGLA motif protein n=1 Tax=Tahibacter caeni TaxID=1453545 RepID=UPI002147BED1|nr:flavohemoglobin expression-modulating QEGLA motif protein [Tahibacter caeni]
MNAVAADAVEARALQRCTALDARLVAAIRGIRLLQVVSWPASAQQRFLNNWQRGFHSLPEVRYEPPDLREEAEELAAIVREADAGHPVGDYLRRSAESWRIATELLQSVGTEAVTGHSIRLYGQPGERLPGSEQTNLDAARHFIGLAGELDQEILASDADYCIPAETLQADLQAQLDGFFHSHKIQVEIDPDLIAKAAAGPTRIRLRSATCFTEYDRHQLLEHEAFVHSLTGLNGREQPHLKSLGRSSPRVTATQEGLAVFAELMSGSIDIERMKRISLRIVAIDMALCGADFIDVFKYFLDAGQTEADSFSSAQRVFRGVPVQGGAAFTKDNVYLHGLLTVHTFFRWTLKNRRLNLSRALFAGKMALHDVIALEPYFASGYIAEPLYLPPWVQRANGLAGMLAFSLFANHIRIAAVEADDLVLGV